MPDLQIENPHILAQVPQPLLCWYDANARILPWRENTEPYRVWVSEIMLQQTRVEAVKPYYERFMAALPNIEALAQAPEDVLLKLWEGLGYYNRVRNLQKAAQMICTQHGGKFPREFQAVCALPGIGEYTAGAICSICFEQPTPAVDGNVLRVVARLTETCRDINGVALKKAVTQQLRQVYPSRCGDFTQSLMELGALICVPNGEPKCLLCPLSHICKAYAHKTQGELPVKSKKQPRKIQEKTVFLLSCGQALAVEKRQEKGVLHQMWQLPNTEGKLTGEAAERWLKEQGIAPKHIKKLPDKKHIFTHIEWHMAAYAVQCPKPVKQYTWASQQELEQHISLPTAFKQFLKKEGRE